MNTGDSIPNLQTHLPELSAFITSLAQDYQSGRINSSQSLAERIQAFFTPQHTLQLEALIPGWQAMQERENGGIAIHILSASLALRLCPEFQSSSMQQQAVLEWIILLHDLGKNPRSGRRDSIHAFRSAAIAGTALLQLGFPVQHNPLHAIETWAAQTQAAICYPEPGEDPVQDNSQLPGILAGIDAIFGSNRSAALILKTILLHMSITVVKDWPQAAPLTADQIRQFIGPELRPLLQVMMLVDNDAWNLFHAEGKARYRQETLEVFARLGHIA